MTTPPSVDKSAHSRRALLAFVLPMALYMLIGSLEPTPSPPAPLPAGGEKDLAEEADLPLVEPLEGDLLPLEPDQEPLPSEASWLGIAIPGAYYPAIYTLKVVVTLGVLVWFWPVYREFPLRVSPLAVVVGVVGVLLWIGCCTLNLEQHLVDWLGADHVAIGWLGLGERPSYNPLGDPAQDPLVKYGFLLVRFFGLALLVPVIEEAFLRAFLMRFVMHDNWTEIPFGTVNRMALAAGILVPVLYHPEKLAALVWFSLVTWLMVRTKNFWNCVVAHSVTNLLLGIYVVTTGSWQLW